MVKKAKDLKDIFKSGKDFQFKKIDFSSNKITKDVKKLKKKQAEILESAKVNIEDLRKITFTI